MPNNKSSSVDFHSLTIPQAIRNLESSEDGLSSNQVEKRLEKYGLNVLPEVSSYNFLTLLLKQFKSSLIFILIVAAVISYAVGHLVDAHIIVAVILVNTLIGFVQEYQAQKSVNSLKSLVVTKSKVYRNSELIQVETKELVPGDVILLEEGDKVPVDGRVIEVNNLRVDEASLTGESVPGAKNTKKVKSETPLADRMNMVFMGTIVVGGTAKVLVTGTGKDTALGSIAKSIDIISRQKGHFDKKIEKLSTQISYFVLFGSSLIFVVGYFIRGFTFIETFLFAVATLVSAIPEGLPAVLAIVLAVGATRLAKKNAIVKKLSVTETLGAATTIITDKTGTLTKNELTVKKIFLLSEDLIDVSGSGLDPKGEFKMNDKNIDPLKNQDLKKLLEISLFSNKTRVIKNEKGHYETIGDPTEGALVTVGAKAGLKKDKLEDKHKIVSHLPFNSEKKYQATVVENDEVELFVLGAGEEVLKHSDCVLSGGKRKKISKKDIKKISETSASLSSEALRVLALAYKPHDSKKAAEKDVDGLIFAGLVGMIDPPRSEVYESIKKSKKAGIRVIMATGDHKETALAISRQIGLISKNSKEAYTDEELQNLSDEEFKEVANKVNVFARVAPASKLKLVEILQNQGEVVAVTGDGVNDSLALRKADIGIAMGIKGTDVARDSADIILKDDNFVSIISAIREGRLIFENVRKASSFLLTTNTAEFFTILIALFAGWPLPLLPTQILWMNLVTDGLPDVSIAFEHAHDDMLKKDFETNKKHLISKEMIPFLFFNAVLMVVITLAVFLYLNSSHDLATARTGAFVVLGAAQLFNAYNMRSIDKSVFEIGLFSNKVFNIGILLSFVSMVFVLYFEPLKSAFDFTFIPVSNFLLYMLLASVILVYGEVYKKLIN